MKLSKSLIQAIAVGITLGAAASSCTLIDALEDVKPNDDSSQNVDDRGSDGNGDGGQVYYDCPGCGMG